MSDEAKAYNLNQGTADVPERQIFLNETFGKT
jgi:hypothetical protein